MRVLLATRRKEFTVGEISSVFRLLSACESDKLPSALFHHYHNTR